MRLHAAFCVSSVGFFLFQPTAGSDACCVNDSGNSEGRQQVDCEWSITMCCLLEERQAAHWSFKLSRKRSAHDDRHVKKAKK